MEKYDAKKIESKWQDLWSSRELFAFNESKESDSNYCIMLPPPNVTGSLHMGHAFQHTLMDVLIRWHRMRGYSTLWQIGVDHAGISTQMVVERQLAAQKMNRTDLGRQAFVEKVWEWKEKSGGMIKKQMQRLGTAIDWSLERFTLDPEFEMAVKQVFISLYNEGFIYRGTKLINWDPVLQTAISDLEVINEETLMQLYTIKYKIKDSDQSVLVATTRPETLLGDVALCVNPNDPRYQNLIGKTAILPILGRELSIIPDEYVDPSFGTGCLKITPAHDFNDYALAKKHNLPFINIFTKEITLNEIAPTKLRGLTRDLARQEIIAWLKNNGELIQVTEYQGKIPKSLSTNSIVEPYLTKQWFVKMEELAKPALAAVANGEIEFVPGNWSNTYNEWLHNIEDWCVSRQLWWGHQIPVWYDHAGNEYVGIDEAEIKQKHQLPQDIILTQDPDVLDTWFSSALWPFVTLGWPKETARLTRFFPTDILVTGFDIIFFWVARMVMFSLKFTGTIPFRKVYITGLIQDQDGKKMSKSKGNVIDPLDLIDGISFADLVAKRTSGLMQPELKKQVENNTKRLFPEGFASFGTDALRFTFCSIASCNRHIKFEVNRLKGYHNFCNKLWNAVNFVIGKMQGTHDLSKLSPTNLLDHWIMHEWQTSLSNINKYLAEQRFDLAAKQIYDFVWNEYCDWYLECSKISLNNEVLLYILVNIIKALHPFVPFITEELWQHVVPFIANENPINLLNQSYPIINEAYLNMTSKLTMDHLKNVVTMLRNLRSELKINPSTILPEAFIINSVDAVHLIPSKAIIEKLTRVKDLRFIEKPAQTIGLVGSISEQFEVYINMPKELDAFAEINKLSKELTKLEHDLEFTENKLANASYLVKAPPEVVAKEHAKATSLREAIDKLRAKLAALKERAC